MVLNPPWPHLSREESAPNIWRHSSRAERDIPKDAVESRSSVSSSWVYSTSSPVLFGKLKLYSLKRILSRKAWPKDGTTRLLGKIVNTVEGDTYLA